MAETGRMLDFTGERYTPEVPGTIALEHVHRYLMAQEIVTDKSVLDLASGEGYGSFILANTASQVVGVDIASDAVRHAQLRYSKANLQFQTASCTATAIVSNSIDVVVSFETIEHHDQHDAMMTEIKRVLRRSGVLIISTPDQQEYARVTNGPNPHHVKELSRREFIELLQHWFKNVDVFEQRVAYGSTIARPERPSVFLNHRWQDGGAITTAGLHRPVYLIALASDSALPQLGSSLFEQPVSGPEQFGAELSDSLAAARAALAAVNIEHMQQADRVQQAYLEHLQVVANLEGQLGVLKNSRSWRLTAPLRSASTVIGLDRGRGLLDRGRRRLRRLVDVVLK